MTRPEYDDDKNITDDTHGCPGVMTHWGELEEYADYLEAQLDRLKIELGNALRELADTKDERDRLREVVKNLLLSADCEWENRNIGHDWADACAAARSELQEDKDGRK